MLLSCCCCRLCFCLISSYIFNTEPYYHCLFSLSAHCRFSAHFISVLISFFCFFCLSCFRFIHSFSPQRDIRYHIAFFYTYFYSLFVHIFYSFVFLSPSSMMIVLFFCFCSSFFYAPSFIQNAIDYRLHGIPLLYFCCFYLDTNHSMLLSATLFSARFFFFGMHSILLTIRTWYDYSMFVTTHYYMNTMFLFSD